MTVSEQKLAEQTTSSNEEKKEVPSIKDQHPLQNPSQKVRNQSSQPLTNTTN